MNLTGPQPQHEIDELLAPAPRPPAAIWVVAWTWVGIHLLWLAQTGIDDVPTGTLLFGVLLSMGFMAWACTGVLRARRGRMVLAWVFMAVAVTGAIMEFWETEDALDVVVALVVLPATLVSAGALALYQRSAWYLWNREKPLLARSAPIAHVIVLGLLVGALSGVSATVRMESGEPQLPEPQPGEVVVP